LPKDTKNIETVLIIATVETMKGSLRRKGLNVEEEVC